MNLKRIENFIFNDGIKQSNINLRYDNWLSSLDYNDYSKSFIIVNDKTINLFKNSKELKVGENFNFTELETISENFDLLLINQLGYRCFEKSHSSEKFYIVEEGSYIIIFSLGGTKSFESIYLHGVWSRK